MVVIISPLFFFSCKTHEGIKQTTIDSVMVYRDTIIRMIEKSDTFYFPSTIIHDTILIKEKSQLRIKVKENKIEFICHEDEYKLKLDSVIQSKRISIVTTETIIKHQCKSAWHNFYKIFSWIVLILILLKILINKFL